MASGAGTQTTWKHIHTRSPFYVQFTTSEDSATMELKVWSGDRNTDYPSSPQYTLVKRAAGGKVVFEIAELIRDYITQSSTLTSGCVWVQTEVTDGTSTTTVDYVADEGYLLYNEALQTAGSVNSDSIICLPDLGNGKRVMIPEGGTTVIPFRPMNTNATSWYFNKYDSSGGGLGTTFATYDDLNTSRIQYASIDDSVASVRFIFNLSSEDVIVDKLRCGKYDVVELLYTNKLGAKAYFPFILKSVEDLSVSSKNFNASTVNYSTLSHNQAIHSISKRITDVKQSFKLNTDWIDEYYVSQFEEMMLSEYVWMRKDGNVTPVTIKTSKMQRKTHLNDKLINYTVDVELGTNYINNLR